MVDADRIFRDVQRRCIAAGAFEPAAEDQLAQLLTVGDTPTVC